MEKITSEIFQETINNTNGPLVVDFYGEWCAPCNALKPHLEKLKDDGVNIVCMDVDDSFEEINKYNISSVPTLIVFNNGEETQRITGLKTYEQLKEILA